ncbi:MAG: biotin carboxylase N-terminal domain-containing protein [Rhizobiaceae bacterium]
MIRKLLIANRGEIACRVMRTARRMGIRTVAVHSDADSDAPHVGMADAAVRIGGPLPSQSYLEASAVLAAARKTGADAVHPGYGFLSENADFAEACAAAGLIFVGPPASAIRAMGDKARAKVVAVAAGVPVVPGYSGDDQSPARLAIEAELVGFPVMLKAAAGGGGRGMRLVESADRLEAAIESAAREAKNAFGDDALLIERLVADARHIEVQVFADGHGNTIHLGERDCSAQRRHQKIIEEAPSPFVDAALRAKMGADAVKLARAVGYVGAGTVEFIVGADGYHFLEMNTRLQVEHPVTEMVTGLDLVEWQLRVAAGETLPKRQEEIRLDGHAIEARLYAEDPYAGFAPQTGPILRWRPADAVAIEGVRVDAGIAEGGPVTPFYDAMLAKVIAHGRDRAEAIARLSGALMATPVFGLTTNRGFLSDLLAAEAFAEGRMTTGLIDRWSDERAPLLKRPVPDDGIFAVAAALMATASGGGWFRSTGVAECTVMLVCGDERRNAVVRFERGAMKGVTVDGKVHPVEAVEADGENRRVRIGGVWRTATCLLDGRELWLDLKGVTYRFSEPDPLAGGGGEDDPARVVAPVTGLVRSVGVQSGGRVEEGQFLAVIEAMKMETTLSARIAGRVRAVHVAAGAQARAGELMIEIEADG